MKIPLLIVLLSFLSLSYLHAQKFMQIEKKGSPQVKKIPIGAHLTYKLKDDDVFYEAYLDDIRVDINAVILSDRLVSLDNIEMFRYDTRWSQAFGQSLMLFGVSWSGYSLIGNATDGDPSTNYRKADAIVSATSIATGFLLKKLFKYKKIKFGQRKRLRLIDLTPSKQITP